MDLGREINHEGPVLAKPQKHTSYPSFNLNDETAKKFEKECDCEVGDELTGRVKLRVSGVRKDEYGHSISFDVIAIDDVAEEGSEKEEANETGEEKSEDAEEKMLGYKRPAGNHETPDIGDLSD